MAWDGPVAASMRTDGPAIVSARMRRCGAERARTERAKRALRFMGEFPFGRFTELIFGFQVGQALVEEPGLLLRDAVDEGLSLDEPLAYLEVLEGDATEDRNGGSPVDTACIKADAEIGLDVVAWHKPVLRDLGKQIGPVCGGVPGSGLRIGFVRGAEDDGVAIA